MVTAYSVVMETAPEDEFVDWQPVLEHCLSSISFTQKFQQERSELWRSIMGTSNYIFQMANEVSAMISDSYNTRNKTSDILSQKRSDATLGYERVLDTETGDYYRADLGFSDWYSGQRYQPAAGENAYLSPIEGYINWK